MKKLTLTFATTLLAIVCAAKAESSSNSTTTKQDATQTVATAEKPQVPAERLTYADFQMIKREIDFSFHRLNSLKSIRVPAMQCHMSIDRVNHLFQRYAHENAEQYLEGLERISSAATLPKSNEPTVRSETTSWPDPYIIGR